MDLRRHLGGLSLALVAAGFVALEGAMRMGWLHGAWPRVLATGFEAGTVGALADWFAVTALFREVPIPFLRRHTNILLRKRDALTEQIADVVQNQWLTPEAVGEYLSKTSPSAALLDYLAEPRHEAQLMGALRGVVGGLVDRMDGPELSAFLGRALREQVERADLGRVLGERLETAVARGEHAPAADALLGALEGIVREGTLRRMVRGWIQEAAQAYAERGTLKAATTWLLEKSGGLDYNQAAADIVDAVAESIRGGRGNPDHPLRRRFDDAVRAFAKGLSEGRESERAVLDRLRRSAAEGLEHEPALRGMLTTLKGTVASQLDDPESPLLRAAASFVRTRLAELRSDAALRERLDAWVLETAKAVAARHHAMIGEMIRGSLSKLEGKQLVEQIESKVGRELQYIRLNGAVIGTLVGLALGGLRVALG
jgi:uncharacterized membrane-anchored protein YjiN (DUF445 family)